MPHLQLIFILLMLACCAYAARSGGADGRRVACMLILATVLSIPAGTYGRAWGSTQLPVLTIDALLLGGLVWVALRSRAFWPLWITSFHALTVLSHLATFAEHYVRPLAYFSVAAFWSLPGLFVMVAGIMADRRAFERACRDEFTSTAYTG